MNKVSIGLYRHFKGDYFYVSQIARDSKGDEDNSVVVYFNVCHPEYGSFTRPVEDFITDVEKVGEEIRNIFDRVDNYTGQTFRFERIKDLNYQLSSVSTEQLMRELVSREDSPIRDFDLEEAESRVFMRDYIVGVPKYMECMGNYLANWVQFDDKEEAEKYVREHNMPNKIHKVYKRVLLEESN